MKLFTEIQEANKILDTFEGSTLEVVLYSCTLKRIAIRLRRINLDEVIYFIGIGCVSFKGKFSALNVHLIIKTDFDYFENFEVTHVTDKNSEFRLVTNGGFVVAKGLEFEFGDSFENFILD